MIIDSNKLVDYFSGVINFPPGTIFDDSVDYVITLGYEQVQSLANKLKINNSITTLDFSGIDLYDDGAKAIAEALKFNQSITSLDLKANDFGNEGAQSLLEAIKLNKNISELEIEGNEIDQDLQLDINVIINENNELKSLNEWFNEKNSVYYLEIIPLINEDKFFLQDHEALRREAYKHFNLVQKYKDLGNLQEGSNALYELADKIFMLKGVCKNLLLNSNTASSGETKSTTQSSDLLKFPIELYINILSYIDFNHILTLESANYIQLNSNQLTTESIELTGIGVESVVTE